MSIAHLVKMTFIFQNCFHIFCQDCISHSNGKCFYCSKQNIQACKIANDMKPDLKRAFINLGAQVKSLYNIHEFQKTHMVNALKQSKKNFIVLGNQLKQMNEESMNMKKMLVEMKEKESLLEAENNNLKECLRRQSLEQQPRKSSPAFQNIFRPVASPPVARKPIQSDHYNTSRGSSPSFQQRPSMFETTAFFQASSKQFGFWILKGMRKKINCECQKIENGKE